jgi:hypothetical protein
VPGLQQPLPTRKRKPRQLRQPPSKLQSLHQPLKKRDKSKPKSVPPQVRLRPYDTQTHIS